MNGSQYRFEMRKKRRKKKKIKSLHKFAVCYRTWNGQIKIINTYSSLSIAISKMPVFHDNYWHILVMNKQTGEIFAERSHYPVFPLKNSKPKEKINWQREGF